MPYNGWTNYETWCVNLHISNEQVSQDYWNGQASLLMSTTDPSNDHLDARCELAAELKETFLEKYDEQKPDNTILSDLLRAALSEVNWHELAQNYVDNAKEATHG